MYDIIVNDSFQATHCLRNYPERPHKHSWDVVVTVRARELDDVGLGIDFLVVQKHLREIIAPFNGQDLNSIPPFDVVNPSAELVAKHIFDVLAPLVTSSRTKLWSISVSEMADGRAVYYGDNG